MTRDDTAPYDGSMTLQDRLVALGAHLDVESGAHLSERVLDRLDGDVGETDTGGRTAPWLRYAAATLPVVAIAAMAVPSSRDVIAGWFGLDGVRIERSVVPVPTASEPAEAPSDAVELPGPGESSEVMVDGQIVLVSVIEGALADDVLVKTLGPDTEIIEVDVDGAPGLWISGAPHELAYRSPDGIIEFVRVAGNTLVWQDGQRIDRLEGFDSLDEALAYAVMLGTDD
ncbi:hypothetical protein [Ilumatobacter coccineus]|uniref:DUF4367 domain-containing protein n=1 Tax=Ilumatobacter coccineus (strain NBRC 103263 / KCTC 29153 / YM16-304) TaxID=1313172 RepID=A0A6C7E9Y7_ILUCY|nr:hypothetical protein [Ilumatobacter coccineus]BAN03271.1 hypothetical protein YM304_29570 [Ilumatobacter coccineus YM16-304]